MTKFRVHPQWVQQAVMQEVQLLQELNHPGIVRLHEFFEANDKLYLLLVSPILVPRQGGSIHTLTRTQTLDPPRVLHC